MKTLHDDWGILTGYKLTKEYKPEKNGFMVLEYKIKSYLSQVGNEIIDYGYYYCNEEDIFDNMDKIVCQTISNNKYKYITINCNNFKSNPLYGPNGPRTQVLPFLDMLTSLNRAMYNALGRRGPSVFDIIDKIYYYGPSLAELNDEYNCEQELIIADKYFINDLDKLLPSSFHGPTNSVQFLCIDSDKFEDFYVGQKVNKNTYLLDDIPDNLIKSFEEFSRILAAWGIEKKFSIDWTMQVMLIGSEVSEIVEEMRDHPPGSEKITEEFADIIIRCLALCSQLGLDLGEAVRRKHKINCNREDKHGHSLM